MDITTQLRNVSDYQSLQSNVTHGLSFQFKDFLLLYNRITEHCFTHCADALISRTTGEHEINCVDQCVEKYARVNQRILGVYMEAQTAINTKRVQEMDEMQKKLEAAAAAEASNKVDTTISV